MRRRTLLPALAAALCAAGAATGTATALRSADPLQGQEWFLSAVGAVQASPPGPGIPLTIVDSGVDASQPDFVGRPDTTYLNTQTVTGSGEFHGTEVASVAAAPANGTGIVGVYPAARLAVWDVTTAPGSVQPSPGVAAAPCPGVIELSLGATKRDPQLAATVAGAQRRGCLVVAAAGNEAEQGNPTIYPAAYPHVLAVGASDETGARASFSSYGPWVDLLAPGTGIAVDTTLEHDASGTAEDAGTSFSAAIVAAAAAWVWTARPSLTAAQMFALISSTVKAGVLDIPAALASPAPPNDPREPNDTVAEAALQPPLTTASHRSNRIAAGLLAVKDPIDVYRIFVAPHTHVHLSVSGHAVARVTGSYAVVTLARGSTSARYVLRVSATAP